jgi:hypothetical protein
MKKEVHTHIHIPGNRNICAKSKRILSSEAPSINNSELLCLPKMEGDKSQKKKKLFVVGKHNAG